MHVLYTRIYVNKTMELYEKKGEAYDSQPAKGMEGADKTSTTAKQGDEQEGEEKLPAYMV